MEPIDDFAFAAEKIRETLARLQESPSGRPLPPEVKAFLDPLADQVEKLREQFAMPPDPGPAPPAPAPRPTVPPLDQQPPGAVAQAFLETNSPPPEALQTLVVGLLHDANLLGSDDKIDNELGSIATHWVDPAEERREPKAPDALVPPNALVKPQPPAPPVARKKNRVQQGHLGRSFAVRAIVLLFNRPVNLALFHPPTVFDLSRRCSINRGKLRHLRDVPTHPRSPRFDAPVDQTGARFATRVLCLRRGAGSDRD